MADEPTSKSQNQALIWGSQPDLDARDPEFLRRQLPIWWFIATMYFRAEVDGLERVPDGPVLVVGNHSGGLLTPDSVVTMLAWNTYFSVDRPLYALAHAMATGAPVISDVARKFGAVTAGLEGARAVFERGASALVYPGGDREVYRPWTKRHRVDFDGRKGFLKLAHECNVPIVPVVADGGHDTLMVLTDGRKLARTLRLDKLGRIKVLPIALAFPFGLSVGGLPPHIPLPTKIRVEVLEPVDVRERFGDEPDWDDAYDFVTSRMQAGLSALAAKKILPPLR